MLLAAGGVAVEARTRALTRNFTHACSYFAIFGNLFGFKNFGKLVAADNIFNSLFGLLQVRFAGRRASLRASHVRHMCMDCARVHA